MSRGVRGATTCTANDEKQMITNTRVLVEEMIEKNNIDPSDVSHVFISVTKDLTATFPAKALREIQGWTYVPVMCMAEIDVQNSLPSCIRIMMVVNTDKSQQEIKHVFHNEAIKLRPDLIKGDLR
ncbi:chorismate mutase [Oceanobacillus chungangensis]|uniref:chorismate mutase n=1 Tax=Oceanobacillus chungangensis TaxID=1229152 RepID=A0A3D8Q328_9BACI|nr:chorismate mutase [Oceanobacillus chungangensis]RDW22049.1 chorismate mutase [Oceanobacillus chungangensis]